MLTSTSDLGRAFAGRVSARELNEKIIAIVSDHLLKQGERSFANGVCAYRDYDGRKCAVGCLIDDMHYDYSFEEYDTYNDRVIAAVVGSIDYPYKDLPNGTVRLLGLLQSVHDEIDPAMWQLTLEGLKARIAEGVYDEC